MGHPQLTVVVPSFLGRGDPFYCSGQIQFVAREQGRGPFRVTRTQGHCLLATDWRPSFAGRLLTMSRWNRLMSHHAARRPSAARSGRWAAKEVSASSGGDKDRGAKGDDCAHDQSGEEPTPPSTTSLREEKLGVGSQGLHDIGIGRLWG